MRKTNNPIAIRLTEKERAAIEKAAAGAEVGVSTWVRLMALAAAGASSLEADARRAKRKAKALQRAAASSIG